MSLLFLEEVAIELCFDKKSVYVAPLEDEHALVEAFETGL